MEITYIGHSCFKLKGKELSLVIDPYDAKIGYKMPKQEADVVLTSHDHYDHSNIASVSNYRLHVSTPGEYEISNTFITGLATYHDDNKGAERGKNTIYLINIDGFNILHLGDLGHELPDSVIEELDVVDVLLIPVGGHYTIDGKVAAKVISAIEPGIVIPMHYKTTDLTGVEGLVGVENFLDEMGVKGDVKKMDKLKITSRGDVPDETEIIVLSPTH